VRDIPYILDSAADLIESGWIQHASARDQEGVAVWPEDPAASCWCATGSIQASGTGRDLRVERAYRAVYGIGHTDEELVLDGAYRAVVQVLDPCSYGTDRDWFLELKLLNDSVYMSGPCMSAAMREAAAKIRRGDDL